MVLKKNHRKSLCDLKKRKTGERFLLRQIDLSTCDSTLLCFGGFSLLNLYKCSLPEPVKQLNCVIAALNALQDEFNFSFMS